MGVLQCFLLNYLLIITCLKAHICKTQSYFKLVPVFLLFLSFFSFFFLSFFLTWFIYFFFNFDQQKINNNLFQNWLKHKCVLGKILFLDFCFSIFFHFILHFCLISIKSEKYKTRFRRVSRLLQTLVLKPFFFVFKVVGKGWNGDCIIQSSNNNNKTGLKKLLFGVKKDDW